MKTATVICLFFAIFLCKDAKSQSKQSIYLKAKVNRIDTTDYYIVIKASTIDSAKYITILSSLDERSISIKGLKDSCTVKVGNNYLFNLQTTTMIKDGKNSYLFVNLQKLYWGKVLMLEDGELPYIALNMYGTKIYY